MRIRPAVESDAPAMARVQVNTKRALYPAFYPPELLMALSPEKTERAWRRSLFESPTKPGIFSLVAENDAGEVVGVLIGGPEMGCDPMYTGEVYVLYVLPHYQGQGIGRKLLAAAARRLSNAGHAHLLIWVLARNPARGFYERLGGKVVRSKEIENEGYQLGEVGYGWGDLFRLANMEEAADEYRGPIGS